MMTGEYKPVAMLHSLLASSLLTLTTALGTGGVMLIYKCTDGEIEARKA